MTEVVGIRFKNKNKVYFFDPAGVQLKAGDPVVVETSKGLELGECARGNYEVPDERIVPPLRCVVRMATENDLKTVEINKKKEEEAFKICRKKIAEHGLDMKLVDVEYNFEGNKILFYFTSDGRVDFRELVKDLAGVFRMRIELRQIGVRDEAKMLGGLGICGRPYCCKQFLDDFQPVSTKMAKTQSMSLNPTKISGSCGRLMCCLRYEQDAYVDLIKQVPKSGAFVETPDGYGTVTQVSLLRKKVKVKIDGSNDTQLGRSFDAEDVAVVPGGRPKPGETPPSVLKPRVKPEPEPEEESEEEGWLLEGTPVSEERLSQKIAEISAQSQKEGAKKRSNRRRRSKGGGKSAGQQGVQKPSEGTTPAQGEKQHVQKQGGGRRHNRPQHSVSKENAQTVQPKPAAEQPAAKPGGANHRRRRHNNKPKNGE